MEVRSRSAKQKAVRVASLLAILAAGTVVVLIVLSRQPPGWYAAALQFDPAAANDADQKVITAMSWAADAQARQTRRRLAANSSSATPEPSDDVGPITLEFTAAQLNSFIRKWLAQLPGESQNQWADPAVFLENGRIILAARMSDGSNVLSVSIDPAIDAQGQLTASVQSMQAGRLRLPMSMLSGELSVAEASLKTRLAAWQSQATIDADGIGNPAAANVCVAQLGIALLESAAGRSSPVDPIFMMPFDPSHAKRELPVRIEAIDINGQRVRVTMRALTEPEMATLRDHWSVSGALPSLGQK
jgi:hypothetical protein